MKKVILTAIMVSGLSLINIAQNSNSTMSSNAPKEQRKKLTADERAAKDTQWAVDKLGLTADQKTKWQAAVIERVNANDAIKEKFRGSTTPEERANLKTQMKANSDKFDTTVNGFLTADQKTKFEAAKKEKRDMHHGKGKMHHDKSMGAPSGN